jgi:hypothetical protein
MHELISFLVFTMKKLRNILVGAGMIGVAGTGSTAAQAQAVYDAAPFKLTAEGFINSTAGYVGGGGAASGSARHLQTDVGIRLFGEVALAPRRALGLRVEANASPEEHLSAGERSVLYVDRFGRFEIGRRRGLPDSLVGYAPNTYAFTSAEFGVTSGRTLDPGGTLASSFLPEPLRTRINTIAGNGASSAFFGDISPKVLYVSPKVIGLELGLSYAPKIDADAAPIRPYQALWQAGLAYQNDFGQNFFRLGGSVSHATANRDGDAAAVGLNRLPLRSLNSLSVGAELNLGEEWDFGINLSQNSRNAANAPDAANGGAHGITASVNYNNGKWVVGGYAQRAAGSASEFGRDRLSVLQLGIAYRIDTKLRIFAAVYDYRLSSDGVAAASARAPFQGTVLLTGVRWTL